MILYLCSLYLLLFLYYPILKDVFLSSNSISPSINSSKSNSNVATILAPIWDGFKKSSKSKIIPGKYIIHFKQDGTFDPSKVAQQSSELFDMKQMGMLSALEAQQVHRFWILSEISKSENPSNVIEHDYDLGNMFSGYSGQFDDSIISKIRGSSIVDIIEPVQWVCISDDYEDQHDILEINDIIYGSQYGDDHNKNLPSYMPAYSPSLENRALYNHMTEERSKIKNSLFNSRNQTQCLVQKNAPWGLERLSHRMLPKTYSGEFHYPDSSGAGVDVYVIDTGIYVDHEEFEGRARWGITIPQGDVDQDGNGHGTHCAGTIGSRKYGIAKKCSLIAVKVLRSDGYGSNADVIKGVEYVMNQHILEGKKRTDRQTVVNMSLGGGKSLALEKAVNAVVESGVHFCVAAGNDNEDACNYSPAGAKEAITVGASTNRDEIAYFSNIGRCVDIFAPGYQITSTWIGSPSSINTISGTSMASPHVAGAVAHFLGGIMKGLSPQDVKLEIKRISTRNILSFVPFDTVNALVHVHGCDNEETIED